MPQRFDGIHFGRAEGGVNAEHDTHKRGNGERHHRRPKGDDGFHSGGVTDDKRNHDTEQGAQGAAGPGQDNGFDEELDDTIPPDVRAIPAEAGFPPPCRFVAKNFCAVAARRLCVSPTSATELDF